MSDPVDSFDIVIVSPDKVLLEGKAKKIMAPGFIQEIAILPDHTPLYCELVKGTIEVTSPSGTAKTFQIDSGLVRIKQNRVSILVGF